MKKLSKLLNNALHTHYKVHYFQPLLYLTLSQQQVQVLSVVPRQSPERSSPLTTATYISHHQDQQHLTKHNKNPFISRSKF